MQFATYSLEYAAASRRSLQVALTLTWGVSWTK